MCSSMIIALLLWKLALVESIRIVDLRIPGHAAEGGQALLGCQFDLEGDDLYSVKWYKDGREFYRFVPSNTKTTNYFSIPGVFVDISRSSSTVVALEHLIGDSGGRYRCEISGEAPYFVTVSDEKDVNIHLLPNSKPKMVGIKNELNTGDLVAVNCTSTRSRPKAQITWIVNDLPAPKSYLEGPWIRRSKERSDAWDTTFKLNFVIRPIHFREGLLTLKCQASLAPLYQEETIHYILKTTESVPINDLYSEIDNYEESVSNENTDIMSAAESQSDKHLQDNMGVSNFVSWTTLTTIFVLRLAV